MTCRPAAFARGLASAPVSGDDDGWVLALDVGGTKVAAGWVDAAGNVVGRGEVASPAQGSAAAMWAAVDGLLEPLLGAPPGAVRGVGVGVGGPMTRGGEVVAPLHIPAWADVPLRSELARRTGLAVAVDNDAKALALAEGRWGAAVGVQDYLAMVVSTGIGGGIVLDGRLLDGASGNAGHIGHVVVEPDGRPCRCGGRGCLEAEASGTAIAEATGRPAAVAPEHVRERTGRLVGRAVASVAALLDLRLAVVAGSVALGFGDAFLLAAQREIDERSGLSFARGTRIRRAGLGADGPLLGAAAVGFRVLVTRG